jgi:glycosyltransferase involved in cell wall biosynthesis
MNAIVDPVMTQSYFRLSDAQMDEEVAVKGSLFRQATVVQVSTEAEATRHAHTFPDIADRFAAVPMFTPYLHSAPASILEKHCKALPVQLLFVGNQARRKGLQEAVDAYMSLPDATRKHTVFTIVSRFDRGDIKIPDDPRITVHKGLPQSAVIELMRSSHVLVNVAHHESYGLIFLEAMSQGTLCLGPDWEVQREILDHGRAGMNVRCEIDLLRAAMLLAIEDEEHRLALASAGWRRFKERYTPEIVAEKYAELFRTVAISATNNMMHE